MAQPALDPLAHARSRDRAETRVWTDTARLDPDWRPPRRLGSLPRWVLVGIPLAVVLALIATVVALGGFERRTDRITRLPADAVITSGPYRLTFEQAVARAAKGYDEKAVWSVSVVGTIQILMDTTDRPSVTSSSFVVANLPSGPDTVELKQVTIGNRIGRDFGSGEVTPGLAPVPIVWEFEFPRTTPVSDVVRVVVWQQEHTDNTVTKTGELSWNLDDDGSEVVLPVTVVGVNAP